MRFDTTIDHETSNNCHHPAQNGGIRLRLQDHIFSGDPLQRRFDPIGIPDRQRYGADHLDPGSIEEIKKENLLLLQDLEGSIKEYDRNEEIDTKLKGFRERAHRCQIHLDNFILIGDSTDKSGDDRFPQYKRDNQVLADKVL